MMKALMRVGGAVLLAASGLSPMAMGQTAGHAEMEVTLKDYNGSSAKHYTVVWVTTRSGAFIKTLRKQGPSSWTSKEWRDHCQTWSTARGTSTVLDGYTSATATTYAGTNSPVICTWDGRDADGGLMPDGDYKFWVQYAENSGQGPSTTGGLLWTKSALPATTTFPDQGAHFANMRVVWQPDQPATVPPTITSVTPPAAGTVGVAYHHAATATGTTPISFSATGLPPGLALGSDGALSGTPLAPGEFQGTITASNGTPPAASQAFAITVSVVPSSLAATRANSTELVLVGTGPAEGRYRLLSSDRLGVAVADWALVSEGQFDSQGRFAFTNLVSADPRGWYFVLRVP